MASADLAALYAKYNAPEYIATFVAHGDSGGGISAVRCLELDFRNSEGLVCDDVATRGVCVLMVELRGVAFHIHTYSRSSFDGV